MKSQTRLLMLMALCCFGTISTGCDNKSTKDDEKVTEKKTEKTDDKMADKKADDKMADKKTDEKVEEKKVDVVKPEPPKPAIVHDDFEVLLKQHVDAKTGGVNYKAFKADEPKLTAYLDRVAKVDMSKLSAQEKYALLINAYNGYTLSLILKNYPGVKSITKLAKGKPWDQTLYVVGGTKYSLNDIEHKQLRPVYKDPRIHFAVNCASVGCPKLRPFAYTADKLEAQLEEVTKDTMGSTHYVNVKSGSLYLTKLMDWYKKDFIVKDFKKTNGTLPLFVYPYASPAVQKFIKSKKDKPRVKYMKYNWNLNSTANMAKLNK